MKLVSFHANFYPVDQDPDLHGGSCGSRIRIRISTHADTPLSSKLKTLTKAFLLELKRASKESYLNLGCLVGSVDR